MSSFMLSGGELKSIRSELTGNHGFSLVSIGELGILCVTNSHEPKTDRPSFIALTGTLLTNRGTEYDACATVLLKTGRLSTIRKTTPSEHRVDLEIYNKQHAV